VISNARSAEGQLVSEGFPACGDAMDGTGPEVRAVVLVPTEEEEEVCRSTPKWNGEPRLLVLLASPNRGASSSSLSLE